MLMKTRDTALCSSRWLLCFFLNHSVMNRGKDKQFRPIQYTSQFSITLNLYNFRKYKVKLTYITAIEYSMYSSVKYTIKTQSICSK